MRRLLVVLIALAVVAVLLAVAYSCGVDIGPFHPPTDGGYWGGV